MTGTDNVFYMRDYRIYKHRKLLLFFEEVKEILENGIVILLF